MSGRDEPAHLAPPSQRSRNVLDCSENLNDSESGLRYARWREGSALIVTFFESEFYFFHSKL